MLICWCYFIDLTWFCSLSQGFLSGTLRVNNFCMSREIASSNSFGDRVLRRSLARNKLRKSGGNFENIRANLMKKMLQRRTEEAQRSSRNVAERLGSGMLGGLGTTTGWLLSVRIEESQRLRSRWKGRRHGLRSGLKNSSTRLKNCRLSFRCSMHLPLSLCQINN